MNHGYGRTLCFEDHHHVQRRREDEPPVLKTPGVDTRTTSFFGVDQCRNKTTKWLYWGSENDRNYKEVLLEV